MSCRCKIFRRIGLFVLLVGLPLAGYGQVRVAVGDFDNQTSMILLDAWARNLPDYLSSELGRSPDIVLVERNRLNEIFKELHLALQGFVNDSAAVEQIGKLAGADVLISGVITRVQRHYVILAHVARVKTGEIFVERVEAPDRKHFKEMVRLLANNILFRMTGTGKYQTRLAIRKYPTEYFLGLGAVGTAAALVLRNQYKVAYHAYHELQALDKFDAEYDRANRYYKWSNVAWSVAGTGLLGAVVCWVRNRFHFDIVAGSGEAPAMSVRPYFRGMGKGGQVGFTFRF